MEVIAVILRRLTIPILCAISLVVGCTVQSTTTQVVETEMELNADQAEGQQSVEAPAVAATTTSIAPDVRLVTVDEFKAFMSSQKGRVVLLDMWATW